MKIKSILLAFLMLGMVNHAWSARVILTQGYFDPKPTTKPVPKSPEIIPEIDLDDNVLTFDVGHEDYTLCIVDMNEDIVYTVYVPSCLTTVNLPATLSGTYQLRLIPDGSSIYFYGYVMF
ncbi:MAG: hypothetical protein IJ887_02050 [Prevotella sp.]|nr:hypothetical protein [Prevotella sp.]